jgi:hypothetical protein
MRHLVDKWGEGKDYGDYNDVYWAAPQYMLTADSFEYQEKGENPTSMANAIAFLIDGDPGDSTYHSIEITWGTKQMLERRLYVYLYSDNESTWYSNEARTYDKTGEWMYFVEPDFYISGNVGQCFHKDKLEVTNADGDTLTFANLNLAPFIESWSNPIDALDCVNGAVLALDIDEIEDQSSAFFDFVKDTDFMKKEQMFRTETGLLLLGLSNSQKEVSYCWIQERTNKGTYTGDANYSFTKNQCEDILEKAPASMKKVFPFFLQFLFSVMIQSIVMSVLG